MRIPYQALLSIPLVLSTTVMAKDFHYNADWKNAVPGQFERRDFHVNLISSTPIDVSKTFQCIHCGDADGPTKTWAETPFDPPHITGNHSTDVMLDWGLPRNAPPVLVGQYEHIGYDATSDSEIFMNAAHWTPEDISASVPFVSPNFFGFFGGEDRWLIARVNLFSDEARTQHIGTIWAEGQAESLELANFTHVGAFATVASFRSIEAEPLANLNDNLTPLLGPETVIGYIAPVPEPETYAMLLAGLGLLGFVARRKRQ